MSTVTIGAATPSASINFAVLRALADRLLDMSRRNDIVLGKDEYVLLWELAYGATDGKTATGTTTQAVVTY
jgi:hypothetical protein